MTERRPTDTEVAAARERAERTLDNHRKYATNPDDVSGREASEARVLLHALDQLALRTAIMDYETVVTELPLGHPERSEAYADMDRVRAAYNARWTPDEAES